MSAAYVAVRDDAGSKSLSTNERDFLRSGALTSTVLRVDGRRGDEIRKVRLQLGRWDNGAECTVQWGVGTRVTSLCTAEMVPPSPDRPNEGVINFTVDLSPMAGTSFRQAPPVSTAPTMSSTTVSRGPNYADRDQRLLSNRILRSIERIVVLGGALDTEALVLIPGKWVWRFTIALTVLDDGGNILDACVLAAIAVLRHYRKPQVDLSTEDDTDSTVNNKDATILPTMIPSTIKEATPLPLHHTPLSISFALVPSDDASSESSVAALIDPTDREELVQSGNISIAMNIHSEVCLLDYGGGCELPPIKLRNCLGTASGAVKDLCRQLETALEDADVKAQKERLQLLQRRQHGDVLVIEDTMNSVGDQSTAFLQGSDEKDDFMSVESNVDASEIDKAKSEAEEAYRLQALDYSKGHVASAVREDEPSRGKSNQGGSLLASLLKAARKDPSSTGKNDNTEADLMEVEGQDEKVADSSSAGKEPVTDKGGSDQAVQMDAPKSDIVEIISDDEDEEETTEILQTEFHSLSEDKEGKGEIIAEEQLDVDDFAMAIKKKKKRGKGKKK